MKYAIIVAVLVAFCFVAFGASAPSGGVIQNPSYAPCRLCGSPAALHISGKAAHMECTTKKCWVGPTFFKKDGADYDWAAEYAWNEVMTVSE